MMRAEQWPPLPPVGDAPGVAPETSGRHNWYPALSRCACGLRLPNAQHWTDHVASVGVRPAPALPLIDRI